MKIIVLLSIFTFVVISNVIQLGSHNINQTIQNNEWVFINFYSPTCQFCKQLSPEFNKLETLYDGGVIKFGKLDLMNFKEYGKRYLITSYPTLLLFNKNHLPILYEGQRKVDQMKAWIDLQINYVLEAPKQGDIDPIVYHGPKNQKYQLFRTIALRDKFKIFRWLQNTESSYVSLYNQTLNQFDEGLELVIKQLSAKLFEFGEQPWTRIYRKKSRGIIYLNKNRNQEIMTYLDKLARKNYNIVFFHIEPTNSQYFEVLKYFTVVNQQSLIAVNPLTGGIHLLELPFGDKQIFKFISDFLENKLEQYSKSEQTNDPNILTAKRQNELKTINKDIVLFLFEDKKPYTQNLLSLAKYTIRKLVNNPNIHVFVCNTKNNDLKLEIQLDSLPKVVFLRHRMKDSPVQLQAEEISVQTVFEFIQENTTFDWVDEQQL